MAKQKVARQCQRCRAVPCTHVSRQAHRRTDVTLQCLHCQQPFTRKAWEIKRGRTTFCSRECSFAHGKPIEKKFWAKVRQTETCWRWIGTLTNKGYGETRLHNSPCLAHRASYELHYGPIPKGLCVLHSCDNPPCVRPDHLFLGTMKDNTHDMVQKGRWRRGIRVRGNKLGPQQVREIREAAANGTSRKELASIYGLHKTMIGYIVTRKCWANVP